MNHKPFSRTALTLAAILAMSACSPATSATSDPATAPNTPTAQAAPADVEKTIRQSLESAYASQGIKVLSINASPVAGLYEAYISGNQLVYVSADGRHMFTGDLLDIQQKRNLSEARLSDLNRVDYAALPLDKAIVEVRGNGNLKVAVFTDADCPYCKRLEREFAQMTDITIYNFMMPIDSLHPRARAKSEQIWCSSDRTAAWTGWMRQGKSPAAVAACPNPVAETAALGEKLGFNGTPTLIFPNGKVVSGYMPLPHLQQAIADNQK